MERYLSVGARAQLDHEIEPERVDLMILALTDRV
jgi:hypothetical protein